LVKGVEKTANKEHIVLDIMRKGRNPMRPGELAKKTGIDTKEISKIISEEEKGDRLLF